MTVSAGSKMKGISYKTAWPKGTTLFEQEININTTEQKITFIYARVSSSDKKENLKEIFETIND